jgi:hypothetical protein
MIMNNELPSGEIVIILYTFNWEVLNSNLSRVYCYVSLSPNKKNSRISPLVGYDSFLYNPFQFIIHELSHYSMLYILDTDVVNQFTKENKLRGSSPQANYTDRATAACWRS